MCGYANLVSFLKMKQIKNRKTTWEKRGRELRKKRARVSPFYKTLDEAAVTPLTE
jgi:hypothetical protein